MIIHYDHGLHGLYITDSKTGYVKAEINCQPIISIMRDRAIPDDLYVIYGNTDCYKLNLFKEGSCSIPLGLLMRDDVYSRYDIENGRLSYYESIKKR